MKKLLTAGLIFSAVYTQAGTQKLHMKVSAIQVSPAGKNSYRVEVVIRHGGLMKEMFEDTGVTIPLEEKIITGYFTGGKINERNFLYADMNIDLNKDGDFDDSYPILEKSGKFFLGGIPVEPLIMPKLYNRMQGLLYYDRKNKGKIFRLGTNGLPFTIYQIDRLNKKITFGIGSPEKPVRFREFPNPCLQLVVFKTTPGTGSKPPFSITGSENHTLFSNEKVFDGQGGDWVSVVWTMKKIDISNGDILTFTFTIKDISKPFAVMASGNLSLEKSLRLRTLPLIKIIR